jgi:hypothetical protein
MLSDTTDAYVYGLCKNNKVVQAFKSMGGERIEEHGKFTKREKEGDVYSYIMKSIKKFCGTDLFNLMNEVPAQTFNFSIQPIDLDYPKKLKTTSKTSSKATEKKVSIPIVDPENLQRSDELYTLFLKDDADEVLSAIASVQDADINTHTFSYLVILSRFHWDAKVRREAKKVISIYADSRFWEMYNEQWANKYKATQGYHEIKAYYEDDNIKAEEYFLFAYANRRAFFSHHPIKGMYNTYNKLTDDHDSIKNVFECHGPKIKRIPSKVAEEKQIGVARIMSAPNLDLEEALALFCHLPNLHNIRLWWCDIKELPRSINKLSNLERLGLRGNLLQSIGKEIFLPNLKFLDIGGNNIKELDLSCFPNLEYLKVGTFYRRDIKFKNVTKKLTVGFGKVVYEEIEPN